MKRKAVALLVTLFFVMTISAVIAYLLHTLDSAKQSVRNQELMIQSMISVDDIEKIFQNNPQIDNLVEQKSQDALYLLIAQMQNLSLFLNGMHFTLTLQSARSTFNVHHLITSKKEPVMQRIYALKRFLVTNDIADEVFVDILVDALIGKKLDQSYYSELFFDKPLFFQEGLVSYGQFLVLLDYYATKYHDRRVYAFEWQKLFNFSTSQKNSVDLNYATAFVWQLFLGCSKERGVELATQEIIAKSLDDFGLTHEEKKAIKVFDYNFFMPVVTVEIAIIKNRKGSHIKFEYDLAQKKAGSFEVEL